MMRYREDKCIVVLIGPRSHSGTDEQKLQGIPFLCVHSRIDVFGLYQASTSTAAL
jgi:hypothetical protein